MTSLPSDYLQAERRFEHGPKKVYRLIRKAQFREVNLILRAEFDIDPEFFGDIIQGVLTRIQMAIRNQAQCGHGQDARKIWMPAFERAVEEATGHPLSTFTDIHQPAPMEDSTFTDIHQPTEDSTTTRAEHSPQHIARRITGKQKAVDEAMWMIKTEYHLMEPEEFHELLESIRDRLYQEGSRHNRGIRTLWLQKLERTVEAATGKRFADLTKMPTPETLEKKIRTSTR